MVLIVLEFLFFCALLWLGLFVFYVWSCSLVYDFVCKGLFWWCFGYDYIIVLRDAWLCWLCDMGFGFVCLVVALGDCAGLLSGLLLWVISCVYLGGCLFCCFVVEICGLICVFACVWVFTWM